MDPCVPLEFHRRLISLLGVAIKFITRGHGKFIKDLISAGRKTPGPSPGFKFPYTDRTKVVKSSYDIMANLIFVSSPLWSFVWVVFRYFLLMYISHIDTQRERGGDEGGKDSEEKYISTVKNQQGVPGPV